MRIDIVRPSETSRGGQRDRETCGGLRVLRIDSQRAPEVNLRLDVVRPVLPVMVPHPTLVEFVAIPAELRPLRDAVAFEFEQFRLDRASDRRDDLVLQFE
jgi:hypothetical protein